LLNIIATGEVAKDSVCSILEHNAGDGKTYSGKYYDLDALHRGGLPDEQLPGPAIPHLGDEDAARIHL